MTGLDLTQSLTEHVLLAILRDLDRINSILNRLEHRMSDLTAAQAAEAQAITDLSGRIDAITGPLQAALDAALQAAQDALAADATDKAAADAANATIDAAFAEVNRQVAQLNTLAQPPAA